MKSIILIKNINRGGYTLGMTLLITSIVLMLTMSIYSLIFAEFKISDLGNESAKAYYSADIGIECVKYFENKYPIKGTNPNAPNSSTYGATGFFLAAGPEMLNYGSSYKDQVLDSDQLKCAADTNTAITAAILNKSFINVGGVQTGVYTKVANMPLSYNFLLTKFQIQNTTQDICADVKVYKTISSDSAITVVSRGYNTCKQQNGARIAREVIYQKGYVN
mgnify:CR=1 FL=1